MWARCEVTIDVCFKAIAFPDFGALILQREECGMCEERWVGCGCRGTRVVLR